MDGDDEEGNSHWTSMENTSLFQQSQVDLLNESTISGLETQNYGLEDLSCSLIHCNGENGNEDHFSSLIDNEVESFCGEIMKRDKIISSLYNALTVLVKHREDGDPFLASVEKQVGFLNGELNKYRSIKSHFDGSGDIEHRRVSSSKHKLKVTGPSILTTKNADVQTDNITEKKYINLIDVAVQHVEESLHSQKNKISYQRDNQNYTPSTAAVVCVSPQHQVARFNQIDLHEKEDMRNQSDPSVDILLENESSQELSYPPSNPDALRLTFSPSICEYEAEANSRNKLDEQRSAIIEDLRLQIADSERKHEATKKYLEEMTTEREQERDDFQRTINELVVRCEEIRKEKEKAEDKMLQQKIEMDDVVECLQESNKVRDELMMKSLSSQDDLNQAVEKICELREIIRSLEEQVEEATRNVAILSENKKGLADDSILEECSRDSYSEIHRRNDDGCPSELDFTEELQAQVQDLAKRIEEKLYELENFPWSARPGSSCSIKSGDDVSVRAAARGQRNENEDDALAQDFVSRISCGLRRLESSFDSLVRFEEVLLKKIRDADLKISFEKKRHENLNLENSKLKEELMVCRQKMNDFESLIHDIRKSQSSSSTPSMEALRTSARPHLQRFEESSPVSRQHKMKGQMEEDEGEPLDDLEDIEQDELEGYAANDEYALEQVGEAGNGPSPRNGDGMLEKGENELPDEYGNEDFLEESFQEEMDEDKDYNTILPSGSGPNARGSDPSGSRGGRGSDGGSNPSNRDGIDKRKTPTGIDDDDGILEAGGRSSQPFSGLVLETDLDYGNRGGSSPDLRSSNSRNGSGFGSNRRSADDAQTGSGKKSSDGFRPGDNNAGDDDPRIGMGGNEENGTKGYDDDGMVDVDDEPVLSYDVTTVSDYVVDGDKVKYIGSKILPSDDQNSDDQANRLEGTDAKVELEKLKTQLDQLQRALDAEKQRSQDLANQLDEVLIDSQNGEPPGDNRRSGPSSFNDSSHPQAGRSSGLGALVPKDGGVLSKMEDHIRELEQTLLEKSRADCKNKRNLDCVYAALSQLQDENQQLRGYIQELENDLQYYTSQLQP